MGVFLKTISLDEYYHELEGYTVLLNQFSTKIKVEKDFVMQSLFTVYEEDTVRTVPSCECGKTKGSHYLETRATCCNTKVKETFARKDPIFWMEALLPIGFVGPHVWLMTNHVLGFKTDVLAWLTNPKVPDEKIPSHIVALKTMTGFKRDYTWCIENMPSILRFISFQPMFRPEKKAMGLRALIDIWEGENVLSQFLPVMGKNMFVVEKTNMGVYSAGGIGNLIDVALSFINAARKSETETQEEIGVATGAVVSKLAALSGRIYVNFFGSKEGIFRRQIYGNRGQFVARAVVSAMQTPVDYDETHFPWSIGITLMHYHLSNKLIKLGLNYNEINKFLVSHVHKYHPMLDSLLKELINDSPYKGIPILMGRNPTLLQESIQRMFITRFKTDPEDRTFSMPLLAMVMMRGDIDGDATNATLLLDSYLTDACEPLAGFYNVMDLEKPGGVSGRLGLTKPVVNNIVTGVELASKEPGDPSIFGVPVERI